jgi:Mg-chelatase subunit ChlD
MNGEPWRKVGLYLSDTMKKIGVSKKYQNVKVSVITIGNQAKIIYERLNSSQINFNAIPFGNTGTENFHHAFQLTYEIINRYIRGERMVIVLMSDGQYSYPEQAVRALKNLI